MANLWASLPLSATTDKQLFDLLAGERDKFNRPWSIAELRLSDPDVEWLLSWFRSLNPELPSSKILGALLITLGSELCRSHSPEDAIWPTVRQLLPENHRLQRELFLPGGEPARLTRDAISEGARTLNLRHAMDLEGTQQWYETIKLQFGFTCRGARKRLAEWLVGLGAPISVRYLNGELEERKELQSDSFRSLWLALRQYRAGVRSEADVRSQLEKSFWIKPSWINDLLIEAKSRIQTLGCGDSTIGDSTAQEEAEAGVVKSVLMRWDIGQPPCLHLELDKEGIEENLVGRHDVSEIDIHIDGRRVCRWLRQQDGSFHGESTIPVSRGSSRTAQDFSPRTVVLCSGSGDVIDTVDLAELGLVADVLVFDLHKGRLLDAGMQRLDPAHQHAVVCDRDFTIEGCQPIETYAPPAGRKKVVRIPTPLPGDFRISYSDFVLWQPVQPLTTTPSFSVILKADHDSTVPLGQQVRFRIEGIPHGAERVSLLIGRKVRPITLSPRGWITDRAVEVSPELAAKQKTMFVRFFHGEKAFSIKLKFDLQVKGIASLAEENTDQTQNPGLRKLDSGQDLSSCVGGSQLRVWAPGDERSLLVLEGDYLVGPLRHGKIRLRDFPRWGGTLRTQGIDLHDSGVVCTDTGWMRDFKPGMLGNNPKIFLAYKRKFEPENHGIVVWEPSNDGDPKLRLLQFNSAMPQERDDEWVFEYSGNPWAIAVTYKGLRCGAWWNPDLIQRSTIGPYPQTFAAMRWLKLPVLHPNLEPMCRKLIETHPLRFLIAWTDTQEGLLPGLCNRIDDLHLDTILRHFLWNRFPPGKDHRREAIKRLSGEAMPRDVAGWVKGLQRIWQLSLPLFWSALDECEKSLPLSKQVFEHILSGLFNTTNPRELKKRAGAQMKALVQSTGFEKKGLDDLVLRTIRALEDSNNLTAKDEEASLFLSERIYGRNLFAAGIIQYRKSRLEKRSR